MTPEEASGVTGTQRRTESFPEDAPKLKGLYFALIGILGAAFLFGLVAWFILSLNGDEMPEGMAVIVGTVGGGLVGVLSKPDSG